MLTRRQGHPGVSTPVVEQRSRAAYPCSLLLRLYRGSLFLSSHSEALWEAVLRLGLPQQQQRGNKCLRPGQWVEVLASKKEDKRFFYSSIGVVQQVAPSSDGSAIVYRVEFLGLPPRSFTRLTLGGSPAPSDIAAVLRSTVRVAVVSAEKLRPLVFLSPSAHWTLEALRAKCGKSNCVDLPDAYGIDLKCPAYGGQVVYACPVSGSPATKSSSGGSVSEAGARVDGFEGLGSSLHAALLPGYRWHIQLNCQHLEFAAKQLLHPRQLFSRFGVEGSVSDGGSADQFWPLGVSDVPPPLLAAPLRNPSASALASSFGTGRGDACTGSSGVGSSTFATPCSRCSRVAAPSEDAGSRLDSVSRASLTAAGFSPLPVASSPKARKRLLSGHCDATLSGCSCCLPPPLLPQSSETHGASSLPPPRKKQQRLTAAAQKILEAPLTDTQQRPSLKRTPQDASVVVELSDEDAPMREGEALQSLPKGSAVLTPGGGGGRGELSSSTAPPDGGGEISAAFAEAEEERGGDSELAGSIDSAMWQTVRTCRRCLMPLTESSSTTEERAGETAEGLFLPATTTTPAPSREASEGVSWNEGASATTGVRRRFRAYEEELEILAAAMVA
ncbi:hypothetical protein cyc_08871 [Cyclospora cayetanensis]|uniref:Uncharacterized protein n=1 Tax=Cyclospora cayetanensis TaxID=88456 RepID=A0A1D3CSF7_9EIME|nr:hypothetical protein cyc_08871 [Cyclospora cayetanensis]